MGIFNLFKNKHKINSIKPNNVSKQCTHTKLYALNYPIRYNSSNPSKLFDINDLEVQFFNALYENLDAKENSKITLSRWCDGTLNVYYGTGSVGRIKLQGKKHSMLVFYGRGPSESFVGTVDDFIPKIDYWITYILVHLK